MALWAELKRRKVVQVAAVYAVTAWLAVQVVSAINEPLRLPEWLDTVVIVLLAVGFPVALILAWAFDLAPAGVRAEAPGRTNDGAAQASAPTFTYVIQGLVLLAVGFLVADQYLFESQDAAAPAVPDASTRPHVTRFSIPLLTSGVGASVGSSDVVVARNGEHFVYSVPGGIHLRPMDSLESERILEHPRGITQMTSSPDGDWVAYFDPGLREIRRIAINGGTSVGIATLDEEIPRQAVVFDMAWTADGILRFAVDGGVYAVPADGGGLPERIVEVTEGLVPFRPQLLPDGDTLLFSIAPNGRWDDGEIVAESLSTGERKRLISGGTNAHFVASGHIVYALGTSIYAVAFDPESLEVSGNAVEVADNVLRGSSVWLTGAALFDISDDGTLVYMRGIQEPRRQLVWVDRDGREELIPAEPRNYEGMRLSPDGNRLVVNEFNARNDIWVWDFAAENMTRLRLGPNGGDAPVWTPDGESIVYHPSVGTFADIRASNNTGDPQRLFTAASGALDPVHPSEFVPDGGGLLFFGRSDAGTGDDLGLAKLDGSDEYEWLLNTSANELTARLAPNGRWLAYASDETGRNEVYVAPFPNVDDGRWQVSNRGGASPVWSPDGSALYYIEPGDPQRMIVVGLSATDNTASREFRFGERIPLFDWPYWIRVRDSAFDVNADATRFVAIKLLEDESDDVDIVVVQNWFDELARLVPPG